MTMAEPITAPNIRGHHGPFEWRFNSPADVGECISLGHSTRMEPSDIIRVIQTELSSSSSPPRTGLSLDRCLVTPQRMTFAGHAEGDTWDLWLVLEEQPETKNGYKIVFDEETKQFGLASGTRNVFIGFYGTFIETLEGM
jgi:hypothetical protein